MGSARRYLLTAIVALAAALAATWIVRGTSISPLDRHTDSELHMLVHKELDLDPAQKAKIAVLEKRFDAQRKGLDAQMRQANAALAKAIESEHQYGPKVAEAVDRSHRAMGDLQKATLAHVFAMRAVLRPDQAARFDAEISKTLTQSSRK
ncbi:MAG: periplasmic heavy metal sensor [Novosphingobium sp.]